MNFQNQANEIAKIIQDWRRALHQTPEVGLHLPQTRQLICHALDEMDIPYQTFANHSGIVARIGSAEKPCIAIRADMDALPIAEDSALPYQSKNENMHACGHDAHSAMLLGAAMLLKAQEAHLPGMVKLLFQPSEEYLPSGAAAMVADGVLESPHVDAIIALHVCVDDALDCKNGTILLKYGSACSAVDPIDLRIIGQGGHGSMPHTCIDPIAISAMVIHNLQYVINREISAQRPAVLSFGTIQSGTGGDNIIPNEAHLLGTIRTTDPETRAYLLQRIEEVVHSTCTMMRAKAELNMADGCPAVCNDDAMVQSVLASAQTLFPADEIVLEKEIWMASEDVSFFFEHAPGCFFKLYCPAAHDDGTSYALHNARFCLDDTVLYRGSMLFAQAAFDFLQKA